MSMTPEPMMTQVTQPGLTTLGLTSAPQLFSGLNQSMQQSAYPAYPQSIDSNPLHSPQVQTQPFPFHSRGSVSNLSDDPSPVSGHAHRMSFGSATGTFMQHAKRGSIDESDPTSPGSLLGQGSLTGGNIGSNPSANNSKDTVDSQGQDDKDKSRDKSSEVSPAWAELKTKAGKERKRLPLACIACRRKKIRCSGEKPACKHCLRSRIPCVYKVTTRKAAPRTDYMAMLDKRLKRMEDRVIKIMPKDEQRNLDVIGRAVVKPAVPGLPPKSADNKKRVADEAFGEELNEWSKSRLNVSNTSGLTHEKPRDDLLTEGADCLPSSDVQQHLAEVFFDFVYGQSYHLLHKPSYMRKLEAGQLPPVLVLAVCAVAARFSSHVEIRTEPAFLRGEKWAKPAREIALKRYDTPNITILISYLLLGLHEFGTCQGGRSWMLGGMAQRMAYALQLHKDLDHSTGEKEDADDSELTFTDREIRRRTMWSCFMMDRFNSSGTDRPIFISEQFIQAQLPIKEHYFQMEITGPTENLEGTSSRNVEPNIGQVTDPRENMGVAAYMVRLVSIWGQLVRYVNLGGKERDKYPMWHKESGFRSLKASIEAWKATLPDSLQWSQENLDNHASEKIDNQFIFLHIIYNQINLFMNRFALPVPGYRPPVSKDTPQDFMSDCARSAVESANQISILVNEAMDHRVVAPFAGYSAFFSSTVHLHGLSSKNPALEAKSKQYLAWNVKFLSKMKKHWGMFHFVTEHLKDLYRRHADASIRGVNANTSGQKSTETIFQYGDWFDRYPHGVSGTDYEDPVPEVKKEPGSDAVLGQKGDLQSVEEFFAKMSPPSRAAQQRKAARKKRTKSVGQTAQPTDLTTTQAQITPATAQQHQHIQIPHMDTNMMGQDYAGQLQFSQSQQGVPRDLSNDMALLQAQQQHTSQAGIMSQLDRQMVLSSYAGMDGGQVNTSTPSSGPSGTFNLMDQSGFGDMDMGNFNFGNGSNWDQTSAWFMPFNLDPPSGMGDDSGMFSGQGYDFAGLGMPSFGDMGQVNLEAALEGHGHGPASGTGLDEDHLGDGMMR